jgi:hypothetical protein
MKLLTNKQYTAMQRGMVAEAQVKAYDDLIAILRKADHVFLEPVTLEGDGQTISDCVFLGRPNGVRCVGKRGA